MISLEINYGLTKKDLYASKDRLDGLITRIKSRGQGFYEIIDDDTMLDDISKYTDSIKDKYKYVVILGIGGSALGSICLKELFYFKEKKKFFIIDNIDPVLINEISQTIVYSKTLFIVITKSGTTPETVSQYFYFRQKCETKNLDIRNHFVFITDPKKGLLREVANNENIKTFSIPENIGGRFSVLTPVGLLPAKLMGIDIHRLIEGAKKMRDRFFSLDSEKNLCFQISQIQYLLNTKGVNINVMFPYSNKLIKFADWYRQLLAESIGKKYNRDGDIINIGITPVNALGATDQHSQNQLYNEGPNDKFFMFIYVEKYGEDILIPNIYPTKEEFSFLQNISFRKLLKTEMQGTIKSLNDSKRPSILLVVDRICEETIGELFMMFEGSIAFLGEMFNINAFDQPGVELSKTITKDLLNQK